jgi:hypothetical protein
MKKLLIGIAALTCLVGIVMTSCSSAVYTIGSGPIVEKDYTFTNFDSIEISHNFRYEISRSLDYSVKVSTHENISQHLDVYQTNRTVYIKLEEPHGFSNTGATVSLKMPELNSIKVSGASRGSVSGFESSAPLTVAVSGASQLDLQAISGYTRINISGASKVTGYIKAQDTDIQISGASRCELKGTAAQANIEVSGASQAEIADLLAQSEAVIVNGASKATVNSEGKLSLNVSGASSVHYLGHPEIQNMVISGASHIEKQ